MRVDLLNVRGLQDIDQQGPIVMVHLMRFRARSLDGDGTGWDAYLRYSALTVPMIKARGGTLLWTGDAKAVADWVSRELGLDEVFAQVLPDQKAAKIKERRDTPTGK